MKTAIVQLENAELQAVVDVLSHLTASGCDAIGVQFEGATDFVMVDPRMLMKKFLIAGLETGFLKLPPDMQSDPEFAAAEKVGLGLSTTRTLN
jgi:hypothetical protein